MDAERPSPNARFLRDLRCWKAGVGEPCTFALARAAPGIDYAGPPNMRALTTVEAAALLSLGGSVLAVAVPTFVRNVHASYVSEATRGVGDLSARAAALLEASGVAALPDSAPLTPAHVPRGVRVQDPPGTWDHPTWKALEFRFDSPHAYSFAFESERGADFAKFRALAQGDLDGDGNLSSIDAEGTLRTGQKTDLAPLDVQHEIE